jgi:GDPmannose 4,6-dehydratase
MTNKTALITGVNGQDGSYLSELLLGKGYKVYGMMRRSSTDTTENIEHLINSPNFDLMIGDITDATGINRLIAKTSPTEIYNLAAMSHVGISFDQPVATFEIDAIGPLNILEAIRQNSPNSKFYQASTSELYGDTKETPQNEETVLQPCSPYAAAKLAAHTLVGLYRRAYDIYACAGILFNHESERRGEQFVTRKITQYVASLVNFMKETGRTPKKGVDVFPLYLGNLEAKRDWSHAEDMVRGMWLMMQQDSPGDFVLASGKTRTVREFLTAAFSLADLDFGNYVEVDPKFYRPADVNLLLGDPAKAKEVLGWEQNVSFEELVKRMVESDVRLRKDTCRV